MAAKHKATNVTSSGKSNTLETIPMPILNSQSLIGQRQASISMLLNIGADYPVISIDGALAGALWRGAGVAGGRAVAQPGRSAPAGPAAQPMRSARVPRAGVEPRPARWAVAAHPAPEGVWVTIRLVAEKSGMQTS